MIGILVLVRLGSNRLPQKHLIHVLRQTMLEYCIQRIQYRFKKEISENKVQIIIASSEAPINYELNNLASKLNVNIFFGHDGNIPLRQLQCAKKFNLTSIISVDGDDILCSTEAMKALYILLNSSMSDYVVTVGLPFGMNVSGYTTTLLEKKISPYSNIVTLETGWGEIFKGNNQLKLEYASYHQNQELIRMTLDYPLDADFFKKVIEHFKDNIVHISDQQLIEEIVNLKLYEINSSLSEEYWINFNSQKISL